MCRNMLILFKFTDAEAAEYVFIYIIYGCLLCENIVYAVLSQNEVCCDLDVFRVKKCSEIISV